MPQQSNTRHFLQHLGMAADKHMSVEVFTFELVAGALTRVSRHIAVLAALATLLGVRPAFPFCVSVLELFTGEGMGELVADPAKLGALEKFRCCRQMIGRLGVGMDTVLNVGLAL